MFVSMMVIPETKQRKERRWREAWMRWPRRLASGVEVGWRTTIAWMRRKVPRDWSNGCGEMRAPSLWRKTADQVAMRRRRAPSWESQAVPVDWRWGFSNPGSQIGMVEYRRKGRMDTTAFDALVRRVNIPRTRFKKIGAFGF